MKKFGLLLVALVSSVTGIAPVFAQSADGPVWAGVKKRNEVRCGVTGKLPGFSMLDEQKQWKGLEIEICRAIAAAALGDAQKASFVSLPSTTRFDGLRAGNIDVLMRNSTATLERIAGRGVRDAAMIYLDGQAVATNKLSGIDTLEQLNGKTVCLLEGTAHRRNLENWLDQNSIAFEARPFAQPEDMHAAFFAGTCRAVTDDVSALSTTIIASGRAEAYKVLPKIVALQPQAAFVRADDDKWFNIVRWTFNTLVLAEEAGVTKANVEQQRKSGPREIRRLLGASADDAQLLGLGQNWALEVIRQVGNYGKIFDRTLGRQSPWGFSRGTNGLWNNGGVMFGLPIR